MTLSAKDTGTYGFVPWAGTGGTLNPNGNLYHGSQLPMTIGIRNVFVRDDAAATAYDPTVQINEIEGGYAMSPQRLMILRIDFWGNGGKERYQGTIDTADHYWNRINSVLTKIGTHLSKLFAITLSEENDPIGGRTAMLAELYNRCKVAYPTLQVYQWWTPNTACPAYYEGLYQSQIDPGGGVYLPADGWVADPYTLGVELYGSTNAFLGADPYLRIMQKYIITRKPMIWIVWMSAEHPEFYNPTDPLNVHHYDMKAMVDRQIAVLRLYNIPTIYYWTNTAAQASFILPTGNSVMDNIIVPQIDASFAGSQTYVPTPTELASKDVWVPSTSGSAPVTGVSGNWNFTDPFLSTRFLDYSYGTGFMDLYWDGGPLNLWGLGRLPNASIVYKVIGKGPNPAHVSVDLLYDILQAGTEISVQVSSNNVNWTVLGTATTVQQGNITATWLQSGQTFYIKVTMSSSVQDVPVAQLINLSVSGAV